jgi:hypothetical protein
MSRTKKSTRGRKRGTRRVKYWVNEDGKLKPVSYRSQGRKRHGYRNSGSAARQFFKKHGMRRMRRTTKQKLQVEREGEAQTAARAVQMDLDLARGLTKKALKYLEEHDSLLPLVRADKWSWD